MIRVLVVSESQVLVTGVRVRLRGDVDVQVVAAIPSDATALSRMVGTAPDIAVVTVSNETECDKAISWLRARWPEAPVVGLVPPANEVGRTAAMGAGADRYVPVKTSSTEPMGWSADGESGIHPSMPSHEVDQMGLASTDTWSDVLTTAENQVLRLLAKSKTNREIASELHRSEATVKKHVTSLLSKLRLERRGEAAALYLTRKDGELIEPANEEGSNLPQSMNPSTAGSGQGLSHVSTRPRPK